MRTVRHRARSTKDGRRVGLAFAGLLATAFFASCASYSAGSLNQIHSELVWERRIECRKAWSAYESACRGNLLMYQGMTEMSFCQAWAKPRTVNGLMVWPPHQLLPQSVDRHGRPCR
ncbi:MAG TPA: hypothetical protein VIS55_12785 [Pseudomonadales bacterium]|jgi:hypothetical protein